MVTAVIIDNVPVNSCVVVSVAVEPPTGPPSLWFKRLPLKQSVGSSIPGFSELGI